MPRESDNYLKYSKQFKQDYTASTADIIDNSKLLFLAREDLTDKSWKALQHKVKLSERVTQMLTKIGKNKILTQTKYINVLPGTYGAIYQLTKFDDNKLKSILDSGKINSKTTRQQINILRRGNKAIRDVAKKDNTKRFLNIRLSEVKGLSTNAMRSFEKDLSNLVSKYKSKVKLDVEQFNLTKRLEDRKKELLSLLERDLKVKNANHNAVYKIYEDRLKLFDTETIASAKLLLSKYSKRNKTSDF